MLRRKSKPQRRLARSRRLQPEKLEQRQLLAANPIGVTPEDTGEFLLGTIGVTPVLLESNGTVDPQSQNWTEEEIDEAIAKVVEGVNWWSDTLDTLNTVHTIDFVIDETYAVDPFETVHEPIDISSNEFNRWVGEFVTARGYGEAGSIEEAVRGFNNEQRDKLGTDWAFTIFIVDSSDDLDGQFAAGTFRSAFAYAGGLFVITPSTRPASTIAHEMGHIFWARDEYQGGGSWTDLRGYYNAQNLNAADNPTPGFQQETSIMAGGVPLFDAFHGHINAESTLEMVGWRDSDGDGIFDVADVPLSLDAVGHYDADNAIYHFSGVASAVPLINQNSAGSQSDITLNRISQLQYRLDDGAWVAAAEPDEQVVEFDFDLAIAEFSTIQWRAIDLATGVTSPVIVGSMSDPALSHAVVSGIAFVDDNADGQRSADESPLPATHVMVRNADGSALFGGAVDAAGFTDGVLNDLSGATLSADGALFSDDVGSFVSASADGQRVFHAFDSQTEVWIDTWSSRVAFEASFDQSVGSVQLDAIGFGDSSFARLEAYDATGQLLTRVTSGAIAEGEQTTLQVFDAQGRIASVRAFGHAGTTVALNNLRFGFQDSVVTDQSGAWRLQNLSDGNYVVELAAENLTHQFDTATIQVEVVDGSSDRMAAAAQRVDSPRYNPLLPEDASLDGSVSSRDALVIINDLNRFNPRVLQASETEGFAIDVNNDGEVSALDALMVINFLGRENGGSGEFEAPAQNGLHGGFNTASASQAVPQEGSLAGKMLNYAGGTTPDESTDHPIADTSEKSPFGSAPVAGEFRGFPLIRGVDTPDRNNLTTKETANRAEPDSLIKPIQPKISEPFGRTTI